MLMHCCRRAVLFAFHYLVCIYFICVLFYIGMQNVLPFLTDMSKRLCLYKREGCDPFHARACFVEGGLSCFVFLNVVTDDHAAVYSTPKGTKSRALMY